MDPEESYPVQARKLSSPVIWKTWRQRGRGGALSVRFRPSDCIQGPRCPEGLQGWAWGSGDLPVADVKPTAPAGVEISQPLAVSVAIDFASGMGTCQRFPELQAHSNGVTWRIGMAKGFLVDFDSDRVSRVRLGSVQDE